jgi:hypothetical protein
MSTQTQAATTVRLTCTIVTPQNEQGRAKLYATITAEGVQVWCKHCRSIHVVPKEACIAAWEQGKSAVEGCASDA